MQKSLMQMLMLVAWGTTSMFVPLLARAECKTSTPKRVIVGVDVSASIKAAQRQQWLPLAQSILGCVKTGDELEIFLIHANTRDSAPLFARDFPVKHGSTIASLQKFAEEVKAFREKAEASLNEAFSNDAKSNITDIFSLLDRVHPEGRAILLVMFTDAYQSTAELNLEKVRLKSERFPELVRAEAQRHNWSSQTLSQTQVDMILPSVDCCIKFNPVNDRIVLEQFYQQLVTALGGHLGVFDTHMEVN
jgi:hypothetical protein